MTNKPRGIPVKRNPKLEALKDEAHEHIRTCKAGCVLIGDQSKACRIGRSLRRRLWGAGVTR